MYPEETPQDRAQRARLTRHPRDHAACGGCTFYEGATDAQGYCAQPLVRLDVSASWWCEYYQKNRSTVKLGGHPLHPAVVVFPLAFTGLALACDLLSLFGRGGQWRREAQHSLLAGTLGAVMAAPVGASDWLSLPARRPAKRFAMMHGLGNLVVMMLNLANFRLRASTDRPSAGQRLFEIGLSVVAGTVVLGTGWMGRQLAYRFRVGIEAPVGPYYALEVEPAMRLSDTEEWYDGRMQVPTEPVWHGPAIPSEPLPPDAEQRLAAS